MNGGEQCRGPDLNCLAILGSTIWLAAQTSLAASVPGGASSTGASDGGRHSGVGWSSLRILGRATNNAAQSGDIKPRRIGRQKHGNKGASWLPGNTANGRDSVASVTTPPPLVYHRRTGGTAMDGSLNIFFGTSFQTGADVGRPDSGLIDLSSG